MIKNLIFDFGKVLVDYDFDHIVNTFFDDEERCRDFKRLIVKDEFIDKCDKEDIPFKDLIEETKKEIPQYEHELQLFYDHYLDFVTGEVPGMKELLLELHSRGFKLYGLTNWCSVVHQVIEKYDILQLLDGRVISSEEHLLKPNPEIFQRLLDKLNLKAEECIFTDDREKNVEGAKSVGIDGIVFKNAQQYREELEAKLHQ